MLEEFLKKKGIASFSELNEEEKATFRDWELALTGRSVSDEDFRKFLDNELDLAVSRVTEENLTIESSSIRKAEIRIIKKIISLIDSPKVVKSATEASLKQMLET